MAMQRLFTKGKIASPWYNVRLFIMAAIVLASTWRLESLCTHGEYSWRRVFCKSIHQYVAEPISIFCAQFGSTCLLMAITSTKRNWRGKVDLSTKQHFQRFGKCIVQRLRYVKVWLAVNKQDRKYIYALPVYLKTARVRSLIWPLVIDHI